jgi:hypothetical protein
MANTIYTGLIASPDNTDPAGGAVAVTKSDTNDIWGVTYAAGARPCRGLYIGGAGDVKVRMIDGSEPTFKNVPVGVLPVRATRLYSTGTGATEVIALY